MKAKTMKPAEVQKILKPAVLKVLGFRAVAEVEREKADERHRAILAAGNWQDDEGKKVVDPKFAWTIAGDEFDESATQYYAACDKANREAGYDVPPGYCPALIAEENLRQVERDLVDNVAGPLFGGLTVDRLTSVGPGLEKYRQFIELVCGLGVAKIR